MKLTRIIGWLMLAALFLALNGCAYYNYLYNANRNFKHGLAARNVPNPTPALGKADFDKVIDGCAVMLDLYPDSRWVPDALLLMGKAYFESGEYPKAERKFLEIEKNYPTHKLVPEAKLYKARCWLGEQRKQDGRDLLIALQNEPDPQIQFTSRLLLADGLVGDSLYRSALDQYDAMTGRAPTQELETATEQKRLFCQLKLDRSEDAIATIGTLLGEKLPRPKQHEYRILRAQLWMKTGHSDQALADLKLLYDDDRYRLERDSTIVELGVAYLATGDTTKALKLWNQLLSDDRNHNSMTSEAAYYRGKLYFECGQADSLFLKDWERSKRDRQGSTYANLADTAAAHYNWQNSIDLRYDRARRQYDALNDMLTGKEVPDSIRNRYVLRNVSRTRVTDTSRTGKSDTTKTGKSLIDSIKTISGDTSKSVETGSVLPPVKKDTSAAVTIPGTPLDRTSAPPTVDSSGISKSPLQSNKVPEIPSPPKSSDTISSKPPLLVDSASALNKSNLNATDSASVASVPDSTNKKADSTKSKELLPLDTVAIRTALSDAEKTLVRVLDEYKSEAFNRNDTTTAIGFYPEILEVAIGRSKTAYLFEYGLMSFAVRDTVQGDSLYRLVADDTLRFELANEARKELGLPLLPVPVDTLEQNLRGAEWVLDAFQDTTTALSIYQNIAQVDSGTYGQKAVAALAILNINRVTQDSMKSLFKRMADVVKDPKGVAFARNMIAGIQELQHQDSLRLFGDTTAGKRDSMRAGFDSLRLGDSTLWRLDSTASHLTLPDSNQFHSPMSLPSVPDSTLHLPDTNKVMIPDTTVQKPVPTITPDSVGVQSKPGADTSGNTPPTVTPPKKSDE